MIPAAVAFISPCFLKRGKKKLSFENGLEVTQHLYNTQKRAKKKKDSSFALSTVAQLITLKKKKSKSTKRSIFWVSVGSALANGVTNQLLVRTEKH